MTFAVNLGRTVMRLFVENQIMIIKVEKVIGVCFPFNVSLRFSIDLTHTNIGFYNIPRAIDGKENNTKKNEKTENWRITRFPKIWKSLLIKVQLLVTHNCSFSETFIKTIFIPT